MPNKNKSKSINRAHKWEKWYIKQDSKWWVCCLDCVTLLTIRLSFVHHPIYLFRVLFLYTKYNTTVEDPLYRSINNAPIKMYPKNIQVTLSEQRRTLAKHLTRFVNNNTTLKLSMASYFLNILASPYASIWFTTGGPIDAYGEAKLLRK